MSEWISVKKAMPNEDKEVLILLETNEQMVAYQSFGKWQVCISVPNTTFYQNIDEVTHWMLLPELPEEDL